MIEIELPAKLASAKGRKFKVSRNNMFFMSLTVFKYGSSWTFSSAQFKMKIAMFERLMLTVIDTISAPAAKLNI